MFITTILVLTLVAIASTYAKIPSEMLSLMNTNADPCDDFYEYSCGGWVKAHPLQPSDTRVVGSTAAIHANNAKVYVDIAKGNHPLLGELWDSCVAVDKTTTLDNKPLQEDLKRIANAKTNAELMELAGEFSRTGNIAFIKFEVAADARKDATTNTLYVKPADLTLPSAAYYSEVNLPKIEKDYRAYINKLMKLSGFPFSDEDLESSAADIVIEIEQGLADIKTQNKINTYHMPIAVATKHYPITFGAFSKGLGLLEKTTVKEDFRVYIERSDDLDAVEDWIKAAHVDDLKVYIAFVMVHSRVQWLGNHFFEAWFEFFGHKLKGQRQPPFRYNYCLNRLVEYMPDVFAKYFNMKAFDTKREKNTLEMVKLIKKAMGEHIDHAIWLDPEAKEQAQAKLDKVLALIGQSTVPKSYPPVLSRVDYSANIYSILSHSFDTEMKKVGQPVNRMEWPQSATKAVGYYLPLSNTILLPATILQSPLFNGPKFHPAHNFGGIGTTIGHELTHGFDNNGRRYDGDGNMRPWWTDMTVKEFESRAQCIKKQYSAFKVVGQRGMIGTLDGDLTLNENIADNGGVAIAWDAYRKHMTTDQPKTNDVTPEEGDQMFFLAYGQTLCSKIRDETLHQQLVTDLHAPEKWRVNGVVMNNNDFAKVFKCKPKTPMNPSNKCQVW